MTSESPTHPDAPRAGGETPWTTQYAAVTSVFPQPELAYETMRDYAMRCDGRTASRCKSCAFLLRALDEIALLRQQLASTQTTTTVTR